MDTKSKKFSQLLGVRLIVFFLCVGLFITTVIGTALMGISLRSMDYVADVDDLFGRTSYEESADMQYEFSENLHSILNLLNNYKSEEYITSGKTISESALEDAIRNLFYNGEYSYNGETVISAAEGEDTLVTEDGVYSELVDALREKVGRAFANEEITEEQYTRYLLAIEEQDWSLLTDWEGALELQALKEQQTTAAEATDYGVDYSDPAVRQAFIAANQTQIDQIKKNMIKDELRSFEQAKKGLNAEGFTYYATDGTYVVTNLETASGAAVSADQFRSEPAYLVYENDVLEKEPPAPHTGGWIMSMDEDLQNDLQSYYNDDLRVYFSFDERFIAAKQADYTAAKQELTVWIPLVAGGALLTLITLLWLIVTTGGRGPDGRRRLYKLDRIWTELQLGAIITAGALGVYAISEILIPYYGYYNYSQGGWMQTVQSVSPVDIGLLAIIGSFLAAIGLWFFLSCVRLLKSRLLIKNSLIYKLCACVGRAIMTVYYGGSVMQKVVLVALAVCLLSATVFLAPVVFVAILVFAPKWVKKYEAVKQGVDEVKSGNLAYKIPITGKGELDDLAKGINEISEASNLAVQNELKNQRMKTELISNVSHDLKTPLTSMVTYIDLMKTEGLDSPNASEYLEVLDQKTNRLRQLTEDLFEAAKASSGAIPVRMEKVEMLSLINQGMGEFDQRIRASGLDFIISAPKEKYYVWADGQLLWRVVENLLSNALKYAQEGTRVYINLNEQGGGAGEPTMVVMEMKNISKQALNIDADELMERFKRGDESRTTEGSGLGLAIAKDLVKLQNGWFDLKIDGDLFKATVMLTKYAGGGDSGKEEAPEAGGESAQKAE